MKIAFKIMIWEEFEVKDQIEEIVKTLQNREISNSCELISKLQDKVIYNGVIYDTLEQMTPAQNNGIQTIEVKDDQNKLIWHNSEMEQS